MWKLVYSKTPSTKIKREAKTGRKNLQIHKVDMALIC